MTAFPLCFVEVDCEFDGKSSKGIASDLLPPKWFKKDPAQDPDSELDELRSVIANACQSANKMEATSVFECWEHLYQEQAKWGKNQGHPSLLTHFGTSLLERAFIDAACRHQGTSFHEAVKTGLLGFDARRILSELTLENPAQGLPHRPLNQVFARHTVGLSDPLTDLDLTENERLDDGLPQTLEDCVKTYGLKHFKIKIGGDLESDKRRLLAISKVLDREAPNDFAFSLDGNEQFSDPLEFKEFWMILTQEKELKAFFKRLLFVEQPIHRTVAMNENVGETLRAWNNRPTIIIDESDGDLTSAFEAIQLGYDGTSHKNCKGTFKSIANYLMIKKRHQNKSVRPLILSGEDLCNQGPVSILQDLCVAATLGIQSVERNGHHYCAGLSAHPKSVQNQILKHHPDVYVPSKSNWPSLTITNGCISTQSINVAPFGVAFIPNVSDYHD